MAYLICSLVPFVCLSYFYGLSQHDSLQQRDSKGRRKGEINQEFLFLFFHPFWVLLDMLRPSVRCGSALVGASPQGRVLAQKVFIPTFHNTKPNGRFTLSRYPPAVSSYRMGWPRQPLQRRFNNALHLFSIIGASRTGRAG